MSAQATIVGAQAMAPEIHTFFKFLGTFLGRYRVGERVHDSATATAVRARDVRNKDAQVALHAAACSALLVLVMAQAGPAVALFRAHLGGAVHAASSHRW